MDLLVFYRVMEMEASQTAHKFIFVDEVGFNLAKTHRRGRDVIGQRATMDAPRPERR